MKKLKRINTTPDASLLEDIGVGNFTVAEAIAELVANSFDWRFEDTSLHVSIEISPTSIVIRDNGVGMTEQVLANAVVLSRKTDKVTGRTKTRKGLFGLGLKTACANLGKHWTISTRTAGVDSTIGMSFDLTQWRSNSGNSDFSWGEDLFEFGAEDLDNLRDLGHGTEIEITNLREKSPSIGAIAAFLGRAYKGHLEDGDVISINGESVTPPDFNILDDSRIRLDMELKDSEGKVIIGDDQKPWVISGWGGLDFKTHNDDSFGFNLYREGQLVKQWDKTFFKVHLMTSRLVGEINLDFVKTNFQKKGFDEDSDAWKAAVAALTEHLKPLAAASRKMSIGKDDNLRQEKALEGLQKAVGNIPQIDENEPHQSTSENAVPGKASTPVETEDELEITPQTLKVKGTSVRLGYEITPADDDSFIWDYIYDKDAQELQAVVNSNSAVFISAKDPQFIAIMALADSVMKFLVIELKVDFDFAAELRDTWMTMAIKEQKNVG